MRKWHEVKWSGSWQRIRLTALKALNPSTGCSTASAARCRRIKNMFLSEKVNLTEGNAGQHLKTMTF